MNFFVKITVFVFLVSQVKSEELDDAMMDDVTLQLKKLQESTPETIDTEEKLEEHILKNVNIAFTVGCDVYERLINGEWWMKTYIQAYLIPGMCLDVICRHYDIDETEVL